MLWLISADTRTTRIGIMIIDLGNSAARSTPTLPAVRARCRNTNGSRAPAAHTPAAQANLGNLGNLGNLRNLPRGTTAETSETSETPATGRRAAKSGANR